jgi:sugar phosphate isomerase/epimerase
MYLTFAGIALHTWTIDTTPLPRAIAAAQAGGADAMEIRLVDFNRGNAKGMSDEAIVALLRESQMPVSALGVEYGWIFADGAERTRLFNVFRRQCKNAAALGCGLLMSGVGPLDGSIKDAIRNMRAAGELAGEFGLRITFEFMAQHPTLNRAEVARDIIATAGVSNVGLLLDSYHLHHSGRPGGAIGDIPGDEIFYVQFSDVPNEAKVGEVGLTDRLAPGRGAVQWRELLSALAAKKYKGYLSYEAPNPAHWERDPASVVREGIGAMRELIAGMQR